jgi:hypothetical protein
MVKSYELALDAIALTPPESEGGDWVASPIVSNPLGYLVEVILATSESWEELPGLTPLFLQEALRELLEAAP